MMMIMATAQGKRSGLIELIGKYEICFADDDNGDDHNGDDDVIDDDDGHGFVEESRSNTADRK